MLSYLKSVIKKTISLRTDFFILSLQMNLIKSSSKLSLPSCAKIGKKLLSMNIFRHGHLHNHVSICFDWLAAKNEFYLQILYANDANINKDRYLLHSIMLKKIPYNKIFFHVFCIMKTFLTLPIYCLCCLSVSCKCMIGHRQFFW